MSSALCRLWPIHARSSHACDYLASHNKPRLVALQSCPSKLIIAFSLLDNRIAELQLIPVSPFANVSPSY
eukprot:scaffold53948_cov40-Prasinocladus_malaysianus.AAC.1